jgi:hypothetical protein
MEKVVGELAVEDAGADLQRICAGQVQRVCCRLAVRLLITRLTAGILGGVSCSLGALRCIRHRGSSSVRGRAEQMVGEPSALGEHAVAGGIGAGHESVAYALAVINNGSAKAKRGFPMATFPTITQIGPGPQSWICSGGNITNHEVFAFTLGQAPDNFGALISDVSVFLSNNLVVGQTSYVINLTAVDLFLNPSPTTITGNFESNGV